MDVVSMRRVAEGSELCVRGHSCDNRPRSKEQEVNENATTSERRVL